MKYYTYNNNVKDYSPENCSPVIDVEKRKMIVKIYSK